MWYGAYRLNILVFNAGPFTILYNAVNVESSIYKYNQTLHTT